MGMTKRRIIAELWKLNPTDPRETLEKIWELDGVDWPDSSELMDQELKSLASVWQSVNGMPRLQFLLP